jgi:succinate dehydrogenase / fumarate reductase membrane anchor subunit
MKSPLNQVLGLGAAKEGTSHWWHQRLTAVAMIPLGLWFVIAVLGVDLGSHAAVVAWLSQPLTAILLGLLVSCLVYHSWLGIQVVLEDYVAGHGVKLVSLLLSSFAHIFLFAVCLFSILKVAFGAA